MSRAIDSVSVGGDLRSHPGHVRSLHAHRGRASITCLDCGFTTKGTEAEAVKAWNAHLPAEIASYIIRFDFPDAPPMYAARIGGALGWTTDPAEAATFEDEAAAERTLANGYGETSRADGAVVPAVA